MFLQNLCSTDEWTRTVAKTGWPYHWVQRLCGLQFLGDYPSRLTIAWNCWRNNCTQH